MTKTENKAVKSKVGKLASIIALSKHMRYCFAQDRYILYFSIGNTYLLTQFRHHIHWFHPIIQ